MLTKHKTCISELRTSDCNSEWNEASHKYIVHLIALKFLTAHNIYIAISNNILANTDSARNNFFNFYQSFHQAKQHRTWILL